MQFAIHFEELYIGSVPIIVLFSSWMLARVGKKVREENTRDHASVRDTLSGLTESVNGLSKGVADLRDDVVEVRENLAKHIGWHEGIEEKL